MASLRRQIRSCTEWLPDGWRITACYWDVESGGIDLDQRGHGEAWRPFAEAGIPRDGGIADLLHAAKSPTPPFAAVVCEDIERSARDMFSALRLKKNSTARAFRCLPPTNPRRSKGSTRPRYWSGALSRGSRNGTGSSSKTKSGKG